MRQFVRAREAVVRTVRLVRDETDIGLGRGFDQPRFTDRFGKEDPPIFQIEALGQPFHFGFEGIVRSAEQQSRRRVDLSPSANEVLDAAPGCEPALVKKDELIARRSLLPPLRGIHRRDIRERGAIRDRRERATIILGEASGERWRYRHPDCRFFCERALQPRPELDLPMVKIIVGIGPIFVRVVHDNRAVLVSQDESCRQGFEVCRDDDVK